ncbi:MAG: T9SS type A sorting domain-containing protein [Bacteroidales bacterium]|nr:T9SS type A sorting domain-containing protein [Bacteroidales bacterium]
MKIFLTFFLFITFALAAIAQTSAGPLVLCDDEEFCTPDLNGFFSEDSFIPYAPDVNSEYFPIIRAFEPIDICITIYCPQSIDLSAVGLGNGTLTLTNIEAKGFGGLPEGVDYCLSDANWLPEEYYTIRLIGTPTQAGTFQIKLSAMFSGSLMSVNTDSFYPDGMDFIQLTVGGEPIAEFSEQLQGWPKAFSKDEYYMNARGLCLADLDGNGTDEIIFGADTAIYAYNGDGTCLWRVDLQGIAYYPPSCADIDNNGNLEILMYTRAPSGASTSYFYIFDKDGNVREGFPMSYTNTTMIIGSPVIADFDGDKQMEIIVAKYGSSQSNLYVYEPDGSVRSGFPKTVTGRFCVTPSVGYDSRSGQMIDSVIVLNTTAAIYAFDLDGNVLDGFPIEDDNVNFSYQSPLICHTAEKTVFVGASHGNAPIFYSLEINGQFSEGWPIPTTENASTYTTPTAAGLGNSFDFYMFTQRESEASIHAMRPDGSNISGFPFARTILDEGGSEGVTTYMYSTDLEKIYIFGTSISSDANGEGYVHIFEANPDLSNFHETNESPLLVQGLSFMSAVNLGDVNGNGKLDLVIQSYDHMGEGADSIHVSVFETDYDYNPDYMFGTYKGWNDRCGFLRTFCNTKILSNEISFCSFDGQLNAIPTETGEGSWSSSVPDVISFDEPNNPNTAVHTTILNNENLPYTIYWTIIDGGCSAKDSVEVIFGDVPTYSIDTTVSNFVTIGDHTFYSTGNYTFTMPAETGCDTIYDIHLRVLAEPVYDIGPNPTSKMLNINSDGFISAVEFYTTTGQLVMRKEVNGYDAEFDMEGLVDGVYILRIYGKESSLPSVSKIVKE